LNAGNCERVKAAVHTVALVTAAVCGAYNIAAWVVRRQKHLAANALLYSAAVIWEIEHVRHHLNAKSAQPGSLTVREQQERAA
jgi:hypothetical protein